MVRGLPAPPLAIALYAVLVSRTNRTAWTVDHLTHHDLAALLHRQPRAVESALSDLAKHGIISSRQRGKKLPAAHTILVRPAPGTRGARYDVVPHAMMRDLIDGALTPAHLVSWLYLDQALGARGYTRDSAQDLAARKHPRTGRAMGKPVSVATLRAHVAVLTERGFLTRTPLHPGWVLGVGERCDRTFLDADAPMVTAQRSELEHRNPEHAEAPQGPSTTAPDFCEARRQISATPLVELTPEVLTLDDSLTFAKRSHLSDARERATGRTRPKQTTIMTATTRPTSPLAAPMTRGAMARDDVREVLQALPKQWTSDDAYRWRPGLAARIAAWLDGTRYVPRSRRERQLDLVDEVVEPLTAAVIVAALATVGDVDTVAGRVLPSADAAVRAMRCDIAGGLACGLCGSEVRDGACPACHGAVVEAATTRDEMAAAWLAVPLVERLAMARACVKTLGLEAYLASLDGADPDLEDLLIADRDRAQTAQRGAEAVRAARRARLRAVVGSEASTPMAA